MRTGELRVAKLRRKSWQADALHHAKATFPDTPHIMQYSAISGDYLEPIGGENSYHPSIMAKIYQLLAN